MPDGSFWMAGHTGPIPSITQAGITRDPQVLHPSRMTGLRACLKHQACPQLDRARLVRLRADDSERAAGHARRRSAEGHAIGGVEGLESELQRPPFGKLEVLAHGQVQVLAPVAAQVAELRVEVTNVLRGL